MMFSWRKRERFGKPSAPDYRDGRTWHPLDVADGRPRLLLTADSAQPNPDGTLPVHIDFWNGITWENAGEMLLIGQRVLTSNIAANAREDGDREAAADCP